MEDAALGIVARIWRFPVKSLCAENLTTVEVGECGLAGDRRAAFHLRTPERARSGKTYRGKEHNLLHTTRDVRAASALATARGDELELLGDGPYFDAQPVSLLVDGWLNELERLLGAPLDPLRFRPNLYVASAGVAAPENDWIGRAIAIGSVDLRVVASIQRCVTTTYDVVTGESDPRILRTVATARGNVMGVYCAVERSGTISVGDALTMRAGPRAPSPA